MPGGTRECDVRYYGRGSPVHAGLNVLGDRSRLEMGRRLVGSLFCDLARSTGPLLPRRGAGFSSSRLDVIGVFIGLRLGILGGATALTLGWGIDAFILSLSLRVWESEWGMMNDEKTERDRQTR